MNSRQLCLTNNMLNYYKCTKSTNIKVLKRRCRHVDNLPIYNTSYTCRAWGGTSIFEGGRQLPRYSSTLWPLLYVQLDLIQPLFLRFLYHI